MSETATGTARAFRVDRGYGFIRQEQGCDIFLHASVLAEAGLEPPAPGDLVTVEVSTNPRGLQADRVISIEPRGADIERPAPRVPAPSGTVEPARVKFFDWTKGFGFAHVFGRPGEDVYLAPSLFRAWPQPPADGEAIALEVDEAAPTPRAARVYRWEECLEEEAIDG